MFSFDFYQLIYIIAVDLFKYCSLLEEMDSYKKLTEKLKFKIRDMGAGSKESRDFLDTFEEVMRDEIDECDEGSL